MAILDHRERVLRLLSPPVHSRLQLWAVGLFEALHAAEHFKYEPREFWKLWQEPRSKAKRSGKDECRPILEAMVNGTVPAVLSARIAPEHQRAWWADWYLKNALFRTPGIEFMALAVWRGGPTTLIGPSKNPIGSIDALREEYFATLPSKPDPDFVKIISDDLWSFHTDFTRTWEYFSKTGLDVAEGAFLQLLDLIDDGVQRWHPTRRG